MSPPSPLDSPPVTIRVVHLSDLIRDMGKAITDANALATQSTGSMRDDLLETAQIFRAQRVKLNRKLSNFYNVGANVKEGGGSAPRSFPVVNVNLESGGSAPELKDIIAATHREGDDDEFAAFDDGNDAVLDDGSYDEAEGSS